MGLIGDLIGLARAKSTTRNMVKNGLITQEQADEIWESAREAGNRAYVESKQRRKEEEQRRIRYECCANCRYLNRNSVFSSNINPCTCTQHKLDFTEDDVQNGKLRTTTCDLFWERP